MVKDYYKILGIDKNASEYEIKQAYRKMALKFHPDKNKSPGATETFREVAEAYEVLSNKQQRERYDRDGRDDLKSGVGADAYGSHGTYQFHGNPASTSAKFTHVHSTTFVFNDGTFSYKFHGDPMSTFTQFFGNTNPSNLSFGESGDSDNNEFQSCNSSYTRNGGTKRKRLEQEPPVEHELFVSLEEIYTGCVKKMKINRKIQQADGSTCREDKLLTINVKPGWKAGTKITFPMESHQNQNTTPADVIFTIKDKPHNTFKREGSDIKYTAKISLKEALCGCVINVPTLTSDIIPLSFTDEILTPQTVRHINGKGLPFPKDPSRKGDLIVEFDIQFPNRLPDNIKSILRDTEHL